jgi:glycosyltransferase involved in cell wall biosynthesis
VIDATQSWELESSGRVGSMKAVGVMLVRDGADLLDANLEYHLAEGLDHIVVTDNRSTDDTPAILERYAAGGRLTVHHEARDDFDQGPWLSTLAREAKTVHGADWIVPIDADEFWWSDVGLRAALEAVDAATEVVVARRLDFVYRPESAGSFTDRLRWRYADSVNFLGLPLGPKVCFRAHAEARIDEGNHRVLHTVAGAVADDGMLTVMHFPMRSRQQFLTKVLNGGQARERNPRFGPDISIVWRHGLDLHRQGRFDEAWETWVLDDDQLASMLASGDVVEDTRLRDRFAALGLRPRV